MKELEQKKEGDVLKPALADMESADAAFGSRVNLDSIKFVAFASKVTPGFNSLLVFGSVATFPKKRAVGNEKFHVMGARGVMQQVVVEALTKPEACTKAAIDFASLTSYVYNELLDTARRTGGRSNHRRAEANGVVSKQQCPNS